MLKGLSKYLLVLSALLLCHLSYSQGTRKFRGRLKFLDGDRKLLFNMSVRLLDQGVGTTGSDGEFEIPINEKETSVTLELVKSDFDIIYPVGGKIGVPKDASVVTEFIIGDSPKNILTKAVAKSNNELKSMLSQLGVSQKGIEQTLAAFLAEIQKKADIKEEELNDQIDIDTKKKEFYPVLAAAINNYTNEAKDLKDAFKFTARHAFDDPQALEILIGAVNNYNTAYEEINRQHSGYEKTVNDLWKSDAKTTEVRELFSYALGELHSANIFILNLKIRDINDYNRGNITGSKKTFKDRILHDIETAQLQLERRLQELDNRAQVVLSKLVT